MAQPTPDEDKPLRIIHCFRSPVGGIFRHVRDLIHQQAQNGHEVGVICDNNTGGPFEEEQLAKLEPYLKLGLMRLPMKRSIGPRDALVFWKLLNKTRALNPNILHSHGAKGGAYMRLINFFMRRSARAPICLYCPHGGSVHYDGNGLAGKVYFTLERILERITDRLIFVSDYERDAYFAKIGRPHCPTALVRNGLTEDEFVTISPNSDATDFVYIGMMRDLKGVDLFLDALPKVAQKISEPVSATLVGGGPALERYKDRAKDFDASVNVTFRDSMPAREAFKLGKISVVPSRAESMPYIVLETLAAQVPLLATQVGGIPEIYSQYAASLIKPDDLDALAHAMAGAHTKTIKLPDPAALAQFVRDNHSATVMYQDVMEAYRGAS